MLCQEVRKDIRDAVYMAMDFIADWQGEDYVGGICKREDLNINSQAVLDFVFKCQQEYNTIENKWWL